MTRQDSSVTEPQRGVCPFCGYTSAGAPNQCSRCGTLLGEAAHDLARLGRTERRRLQRRKALADLFFLVGLLLGGPMISFGGEVRIGAFVVLAGGLASVLRRYTEWSTPGTMLIGSLVAMALASWVVEPGGSTAAETTATEAARSAYAAAVSAKDPDILVDARGPSSSVIWYVIPAQMTGVCGAYPDKRTRAHLAKLGFRRVVVREPNGEGGICSFVP